MNNGGTAFPIPGGVSADGYTFNPTGGMSLRDYFAAKALAAIIANGEESLDARDVWSDGPPGDEIPREWDAWTGSVAVRAYHYADAMLAERMRGKA